jgi:hypothetical protein
MPKWIQRWAERYALLPQYFTAIAKRWQDYLWGPSVVAVAMVLVFALGHLPAWAIVLYFVFVLFIAGYFAWRADHLRLMPKFAVTEMIAHPAETETRDFTLYVQIVPECLTDAPVYECRGELLRVSHRHSSEEKWTVTGLNFPLILGWDCYGIQPFTLQPGIKRRLNVCWWDDKRMFIRPAVEPLPSLWRTVFDSLGTFKFDIRITAKDCSPVDVSVTVNLDERIWDRPKIHLLRDSAIMARKA